MRFSVLSTLGLVAAASAAPSTVQSPVKQPVLEEREVLEKRAPKVTIPIESGDIVGASLLGVESFRGIPFADAPEGNLRLRPPQKLSRNLGTFDATPIAPACPQMLLNGQPLGVIDAALGGLVGGVVGNVLDTVVNLPILQNVTGKEDCLSLTVQRPAGVKKGDNLPVLVWIYGGGFEFGSTSMYDGSSLLGAASAQNQDFIYVAINYRLTGFGFMNGKEILEDGAANLGLLDQRMGLEWVADNIEAFGGDPSKVTIWGESAGAISVFDQMALYGGNVTYKGKDLFRGAMMSSGSIIPTDPVDCPKGQAIYDAVVKAAGCEGSKDTLNCLRQVPYQTYLKAVNSVPGLFSYESLALSYLPRPDGVVLPDSPNRLAAEGRYHAVPMIIGDQEDEGTLFSLFQSNLTTAAKQVDYFSEIFFHSATKAQLKRLVDSYSPPISGGSPFRSGLLNELYPGFKRLAAIIGDLVFTLTRRVFLESATAAHPDVPSWSYLSSYAYGTPILGTFHATDLLQVFYGLLPNYASTSARTYYFNFVHNLDPNKGITKLANWPQWKDKRDLMWFKSPLVNGLLKDDFREKSFDVIDELMDDLHV